SPILRVFSSIPSEVHIDAAATQLSIQVPKGKKFVGSKQHMDRPRAVSDGLDHIQLVQEFTARFYFGEVLRFVDQHSYRAAKPKGLLHGVAILSSNIAPEHLAGQPSTVHPVGKRQALVTYEGLLDLAKHPLEVIAPVEAAEDGGHRAHTYDRDCCTVRRQFRRHRLNKNLFNPGAQGSLADAGRAKHHDESVGG